MVLVVNNLGGLSFLELGIMADAAVRCLGESQSKGDVPQRAIPQHAIPALGKCERETVTRGLQEGGPLE